MSSPTEKELSTLTKFREVISDIDGSSNYSDLYCLSWLRARDLDINRANEMLRKHLKWKKDEDIDGIESWEPPSNYSTDYQYEILGSDFDGRPILFAPFGDWDFREAVSKKEAGTILRYFDSMFEAVMKQAKINSDKYGKEITQFVAICDLENASMRQITSIGTVNVIMSMVKRFEANYPNTAFKLYLINSYKIVKNVFSMLKPLFNTRTLEVIKIYTKAPEWIPILTSSMPKEILPPELGGTRKDQRNRIASIPSEDRNLTETLDTQFISIEVEAGKKLELEFTVTKPQTKIGWTFTSENHEIGFSINFNRIEDVVPMKICDSHMNEEHGDYTCTQPGEYFTVFHNTFSSSCSTIVHYRVDLIEP